MTSPTFVPRLSPEQSAQALEASHSLWGGGRTREERLREYLGLRARGEGEILTMAGLVDDSGNVLCSLKRYHFPLHCRGQIHPCVGLGAIFTPPRHRGKGLASELVRTVLTTAAEEGYRMSLLFSDIAPAFYERLGFVAFPALSFLSPVSRLPQGTPLTLRPAGERDKPRQLAWYEAQWPRDWLRVGRNRTLWDFFRAKNPGTADWILLAGQREVGYLSWEQTAEKLFVNEWVAPEASAEQVWATVRRQAEQSGLEFVAGWVGPRDGGVSGIEPTARLRAIPMGASLDPRLRPEDLGTGHAWFLPLDHF